jgi:hypothetical protein
VKRVAVVEAGHPRADSLASLFLLFGYGGLSVASHLHRNGYEAPGSTNAGSPRATTC